MTRETSFEESFLLFFMWKNLIKWKIIKFSFVLGKNCAIIFFGKNKILSKKGGKES